MPFKCGAFPHLLRPLHNEPMLISQKQKIKYNHSKTLSDFNGNQPQSTSKATKLIPTLSALPTLASFHVVHLRAMPHTESFLRRGAQL